jgi:hypothetical protein
MSRPITSSESSTSVVQTRGSGRSRTGAEDRNVPSFRALFERQTAYFATEGDGG